MKILLKLAWRNLWRNRKRSLITISSVFFAVLLSIVMTSMQEGSYERMIESLVRYSTGYIQIQDVLYEEEPSIDNSLVFDEQIHHSLNQLSEDIEFYVPRIQNFALAATKNQTRGTLVLGIEPDKENRLNNLLDNMIAGEFITSSDNQIVIASGLSNIMGLRVGDTLILLGQGLHGATAAGRYRIKGIVNLRLPEINNNTIYMPLTEAQWFFMAEDRLTSLIIMPHDPDHTNRIASELQASLDNEWFSVLTWKHLLADFLSLMEFDRAGGRVMSIILYIVITFGLLGTIITMMIERQKEFGMLISLGMNRMRLALVCFLETLFISGAGVVAGVAASVPVVGFFYFNPIPLHGDMAQTMLDYGFEPIMPFSTDPGIFLTQAAIIVVLSVLVGLYPIYRVYRLNIIQVRQ